MTSTFPARLLHALHCAAALTLIAPTLPAAPATPKTPAPAAAPAPAPAPAAAAAPAAAPAPAPAHLSLWLDLGHSGLDRNAVRAAIEQELGTPVELTNTADTPLRVSIESDQRLHVAFTTSSGEALSRTVDLPADRERRIEIIALMVGNLTRNEAADLLATLEAARRAAAAPRPAQAAPAPSPKSEAKTETKPTTAPAPKPAPLLRTAPPGINLSLYHPLAIFPDSHRRVLKVELGLAYSRVGAIEGAALSLGGLRVEQHVRGYVFGGFFAITGGPVQGFQSSYIYSESRGPVYGLDVGGLVLKHSAPITGIGAAGLVELGGDIEGLGVAGLVNVSEHVKGGAIGGLVAVAREPVEGLLLGGLFTYGRSLEGVGVAGLVHVGGDTLGAQIAGLGNVSGNVKGLTIGGLANVTGNVTGFALGGLANVTGDVEGATLSVVNIGQRVRGAQIGVVNIAGEVDGAQIGLVNLAKNGRIQAQAFATNTMPINAGIRFVSGYSYSELALGYDPGKNDNQYSAGLGAHFDITRLTLEAGVHGSTTQHAQTNEKPTRIDLHYRARVGYRVTSFFEPFVGGGARHGMWGEGKDEVDPEILAGVALF